MAMTLITTNTHTGDSDATSDFTSSIDGTYKLYIFKFINMNPVTDEVIFTFNGSIDGGSNYNVTKTSTAFYSAHSEDDSTWAGAVAYNTGLDLAQSTDFQALSTSIGNGGDESCSGTLWLFNPSNTTYVKHFYSRFNSYKEDNASFDNFFGGYFNTTDNIDAIQFKFSSGNMDGTIKMYGVG